MIRLNIYLVLLEIRLSVIKYGFQKLFTKDYVKSLVKSYELDKTDVFSIITDTAIKEWCEDNGYWDTELQSPTESYEDIPWNFVDLILNCSEIPFTDEYLESNLNDSVISVISENFDTFLPSVFLIKSYIVEVDSYSVAFDINL